MNNDTQQYGIEKLRKLVNFFNNHDEGFNLQFSTINQLEEIYNFAKEKDYEFLDSEALYYGQYEDEEVTEIEQFIKKVINN